jgi:hypothetical protein
MIAASIVLTVSWELPQSGATLAALPDLQVTNLVALKLDHKALFVKQIYLNALPGGKAIRVFKQSARPGGIHMMTLR